MRVEFVARGVVCLAAMPPSSLDLGAFEAATGLSRAQTQVINPQLALADYGSIRLLVVPTGQVHVDAQSNAGRELCRSAAAELIRQATPYALRAVGFNGQARVRCEDGEDPVGPLLNHERINGRLGTDIARSGIKLVYPLGTARATLDLFPSDDDLDTWTVAINRHYGQPPDAEELERAISWFGALSDELVSLVRRLVSANTEDAQHVA